MSSLSINSSNVELKSKYTTLSDRSWRQLIFLFMVREFNFKISGQKINWDSINALRNILRLRVTFPAIRPNARIFLLTF